MALKHVQPPVKLHNFLKVSLGVVIIANFAGTLFSIIELYDFLNVLFILDHREFCHAPAVSRIGSLQSTASSR